MHYIVVSPVITESYSYSYEPPEDFCCVVSVDATDEKDAKKKAIKTPEFRDWVQEQRDNNANPFTGLKVYEGECHHEVCQCGICGNECERCLIEADYQDEERY